MKYQEFYKKYGSGYPPSINPWLIVLITIIATLLEPILAMKSFKHVDFTVDYYFQQLKYFSFVSIPTGIFLFWVNSRESIKRSKGYYWIGKFQVISKETTLLLCYLKLSPGKYNKLKVDKTLFDKTQVGDFVIIKRDALGDISEIKRVNNFLGRLTRHRTTISH